MGAATVLLGAGCGVLGSTINPFATGAAIAAAADRGSRSTWASCTRRPSSSGFLHISYPRFCDAVRKSVRAGGGSILTGEQLGVCRAAYGASGGAEEYVRLTVPQKRVAWLFALSFVVMILGFIPWGSLSEDRRLPRLERVFSGSRLGDWWFDDAASWFLIMGIIIGVVGLKDRSRIIQCIISGFGDMIAVNLVIALAARRR